MKLILLSLLLSVQTIAFCKNYLVTDYGVLPNQPNAQTDKIQKLIQEANQIGGGVITFPAGNYLTGSIFLCSNLKMVIEPGAILQASPHLKDYTPGKSPKIGDRNPIHFITADHLSNVSIEGGGTIDGNGPAFWKKDRPSEWDFYTENELRPSPMLDFVSVKNLTIRDITISNSAGWTLHINQCSQVSIHAIQIDNNILGPNTDGIDINGSDHVRISDCSIKTGDDAIVCKTSADAKACEYITVTNCILETNCIAMKIGTESHFDFKHIQFSNCIVKRSSRMFGIVVLDGGNVDQVQVSNIMGSTNCGWILNRFIHINVDQRTENSPLGSIKNVFIQNMNITTDGRAVIAARKEGLISNIHLDQIRVHLPLLDDPDSIGRAANNNIHFFKSNPEARSARAVFAFENVDQLKLTGLSIQYPTYPITQNWELLKTGKNWGNLDYVNNATKARIIAGQKKVAFKALWAKRLNNSFIDLSGVSASENGLEKFTLLNSKNSKIVP